MKTTAAASLIAGGLAFALTRAIRAALAADKVAAAVRFADDEESPHVRAARAVA